MPKVVLRVDHTLVFLYCTVESIPPNIGTPRIVIWLQTALPAAIREYYFSRRIGIQKGEVFIRGFCCNQEKKEV